MSLPLDIELDSPEVEGEGGTSEEGVSPDIEEDWDGLENEWPYDQGEIPEGIPVEEIEKVIPEAAPEKATPRVSSVRGITRRA